MFSEARLLELSFRVCRVLGGVFVSGDWVSVGGVVRLLHVSDAGFVVSESYLAKVLGRLVGCGCLVSSGRGFRAVKSEFLVGDVLRVLGPSELGGDVGRVVGLMVKSVEGLAIG